MERQVAEKEVKNVKQSDEQSPATMTDRITAEPIPAPHWPATTSTSVQAVRTTVRKEQRRGLLKWWFYTHDGGDMTERITTEALDVTSELERLHAELSQARLAGDLGRVLEIKAEYTGRLEDAAPSLIRAARDAERMRARYRTLMTLVAGVPAVEELLRELGDGYIGHCDFGPNASAVETRALVLLQALRSGVQLDPETLEPPNDASEALAETEPSNA